MLKLSEKVRRSFNVILRVLIRIVEVVGNFTVFNIKGNNYRLIVNINYIKQIIYIKYVLTHTEYDKNYWKRDPYF